MRIIPTRIHAVSDYITGMLLIALPFFLGFPKAALETAALILTGGATIAYSLGTGYEGGVVKIISMRTHLLLDFIFGALLIASPWLLGFSARTYMPHVIAGIVEVVLSVLTITQASNIPLPGGGRKRTRRTTIIRFRPNNPGYGRRQVA